MTCVVPKARKSPAPSRTAKTAAIAAHFFQPRRLSAARSFSLADGSKRLEGSDGLEGALDSAAGDGLPPVPGSCAFSAFSAFPSCSDFSGFSFSSCFSPSAAVSAFDATDFTAASSAAISFADSAAPAAPLSSVPSFTDGASSFSGNVFGAETSCGLLSGTAAFSCCFTVSAGCGACFGARSFLFPCINRSPYMKKPPSRWIAANHFVIQSFSASSTSAL